MSENNFRIFCVAAIIAMFALIGWAIYHHIEHDYHEQDIRIQSPWFEYKGDGHYKVRP